ncbi:pyridoxamine 5'-phosphate oxidase family protein [Actinomycetes bacterium M1A6_2h]
MTMSQFRWILNAMNASEPLSPTARTTLTRLRERASENRHALAELLDSTYVCHLGVVVDGSPRVMPTAFAVDYAGPDRGGTLYLHGSVAARSLVAADGVDVCVTVTQLDGLVLARSAFHHSMNYRSAVIHGCARRVDDVDERDRALDAMVDHIVPGRSSALRSNTKRELAATLVLALPLYEASVKSRSGPPQDDEADIAAGGVWAGVVSVEARVGPTTAADDLGAGVLLPSNVDNLVTR